MTNQLALSSSRPLAYRLPNCELITSLPYTEGDQELNSTNKNIVRYLIETEVMAMKEENSLEKTEYYKDSLPKIPATPFVES